MGHSASKYEHSHSIRNKLRNLLITYPEEKDLNFLSFQTGMSKEEIRRIFDKHLLNHPNGKMNRQEFCDLYHELRKESHEVVQGLSENVFKALKVEDENEMISLSEFLMIYGLTSRGDISRKLEYAFDLYDTNKDNALDVEECQEVIYGILELFRPTNDDRNIAQIAKDAFKNLKISQVVKKG